MIKTDKHGLLIGIYIVLLLAGIIGSVWILLVPHSTKVNIIQDGVVLYSLDLSQSEDQILDITYGGRCNTIQIENGKIRVLEADCSDKICVHMGWLDSCVLPIVCLPNHLVIEYAGVEEDVDAIVK